MEHEHDGSSIDLERRLIQYMSEGRITRRQLLERMGAVGVVAALAPVVAACTTGGNAASADASTPSAAPSAAAAAGGPSDTPAAVESAPPTATPEPTPEPTPESDLYIWNYPDYMGPEVTKSFEAKYGTKIQFTPFDSYEGMYAKVQAGDTGHDITWPASTDIPPLIKTGKILPLDLGLIPNVVNLGKEWLDPGYDPGNQHSMPYMWWTTGVAYDTKKVSDKLTSWKALWDPRWAKHISMLDDQREVFAAALIQLGYSANTTSDSELDAALQLLQQQKPLVRTYTIDDIGVLSSGDAWVAHAWGSDVYQVKTERPSVTFYIPDEGGVRGSDAAVILQGAQHPVAANLFINYLLDAKISAANTNAIGYMGPNAAARAYIDPTILKDPTVNPDQATIDKLQELLDLGADLDKYATRYTALRAG